MHTATRKNRNTDWGWLLITFAALFAFGIPVLAGWLSFYGDDWIYIYNYHLVGPDFKAFVAWDRPYSAWVYDTATRFFGENPLPYHLLLLFQRWLASLLFYGILQLVWKNSKRMTLCAALVFSIYPGFRQQAVSVQFILHFASLCLFLASVYFMIQSSRWLNQPEKRNKIILFTISGFLMTAVSLFSCEYFAGLELLRPVLLFFAYKNSDANNTQQEKRWSKFFRLWLPYFAAGLLFLFWRVFVFSFQTYQPKLLQAVGAEGVQAFGAIGAKILRDILTVLAVVWRKALVLPALQSDRLLTISVASIGALLCVLFFARRKNSSSSQSEKDWFAQPATQFILTGGIALFAAGAPFWATMIHVELTFPWDRSTLPFSLGVAWLLAAFIHLVFQRWAQSASIALLVAASLSAHLANGVVYRQESQKMNDYFWQLAWRAPALEAGTIIISDEIPLDRTSDNDLTPILNWQYAPALQGAEYQYKLFELHLREAYYPAFQQKNAAIEHTYRSHTFQSSSEKLLAVFYKKNGCLWVIDAKTANYPDLPESIYAMAPYSNPAVIQVNTPIPMNPPAPIGAEPQHTYCYFFQQANRALQTGDWEKAQSSAQQIETQALYPFDPLDWAPIFQIWAHAGEWDKIGRELTRNPLPDRTKDFFCSQLIAANIQVDNPADAEQASHLQCDWQKMK